MKRLWDWIMTPLGVTITVALLGGSFIAVQLFVPQWEQPLNATPHEGRMGPPK